MRYPPALPLLALLFVTVTAWAADAPATCVLQAASIVGHSASGGAQVSNVGEIEVQCSVPARPFPSKPGQSMNGLTATATSDELSPDGTKVRTPVEVHVTGGGSDSVHDWTTFLVHIPLKPAERNAEARRYLNRLRVELNKDKPASELLDALAQPQMQQKLSDSVYQHRLGRYQVICNVLDGDRVIGVGTVELEVIFKGRFSDMGPILSGPM